MWWRDLLSRILIDLGVIPRPHLYGRIMDRHPTPDELREGILVLVKDSGHLKWACFRCPCGCGEKLQLSLNPSRRPRWIVTFDSFLRPTVSPSIHQLNACQCHFWIKRGMIQWCRDSGPIAETSKRTSIG